MIGKMTRYAFILLRGEEEGFLDRIQELGLVDITRSVKPVDERSGAMLAVAEKYKGLKESLEKIQIPEGIVPQPVEGELETAVKDLLDQLSALREARKAAEKELAAVQAWGAFDPAALEGLARAGAPVHFHVVSEKSFREEWASEYALEVGAREGGRVFLVVVGDDSLPDEVPAPKTSCQAVQARLDRLQEEEQALLSRAAGLQARAEELEAACRAQLGDLDRYLAGVSAETAAEDHVVTFVGYAPVEDDAAVQACLDRMGVFYAADPATVEENPPIRLRNNKFVRMFEVLTDMYGRPAYDGFDPTPFISVFFLLFFAFCMGDCGYGLILIVLGLLLRKAESFKDLSPLVVTLGIGTTVIGFLFHTFFSMDIASWSIFAPIQGIFLPGTIAGYDGTMVLALVVGIVHISLAMVVKTIHETRTKGFLNCLGTWGWTLLIVGGVIVGGFALAGVLDKDLTKWIVIGLGVLSALGIFLLNDLHRNPLLNIGAGLWETYNTVTGLLGDVLSYLRLYALGLAGAMLGKAFNDIGAMILGDGSSYVLWIPFVLVVLVGHTLNIAMAALGAFVHPLRLNFLEFFKNSGYEGSGRNFNPLKK